MNCGFLLVERENFSRGRDLFGSRSPVLTCRRVTVFAGKIGDDGADTVPGDEVLSLLMTDEAFAGLAFGSGAYAPPATVDRAAGEQIMPYDVSWREGIEARAVESLTSLDQPRRVRAQADIVREIVAGKGFVSKTEGQALGFSLLCYAENLFRDAEFELEEYAKATILGAVSDRISMSASVSHADGIIERIQEERGLVEDHSGHPLSNWLLELMTNGRTDPRQMCVTNHQTSGALNGHSDMPDAVNFLSLSFGPPMRGQGERLNDEDRLYPDTESLRLRITAKEMIMAIENGAHGDPVRCEIERITGLNHHVRHAYRSPWGELPALTPDTGSRTEDLDREAVMAAARSIAEELRLGASARKGHADLADRMNALAEHMEDVARSFERKTRKDRERIRDEVAEMSMREIRGSRILGKIAAIREEMQITAEIGKSSHAGPGFL